MSAKASRRVAAVVGVSVLVSGCGETAPIPAEDLAIRVASDGAGAADVEFGRAFPLTVTRVWDRRLVPEEWDASALAPLVTREVGTARREDKTRVEERREHLAWAFEAGDVTVAAPVLVAVPADGGTARTTSGEPLTIRIRPVVDRASPGPAELPGDPLDEPRPGLLWAVLAALLAATTALLVVRRRRAEPRPVESAAPAPSPEIVAREGALRRLAALRAGTDATATCAGAAAVLRDFVAERFEVPAAFRTTDEIVPATARADGVAPSSVDELSRVLRTADLIHFARHVPSPSQASDRLDAAERFVRAQVAGAEPPGGAP